MTGAIAPTGAKRALWGDRGVKVKVLTAVGAASAVAATVGVLGLSALGTSAQTTDGMYLGSVKAIVDTGDMRSAFGNLGIGARNAVIARTPQEAQQALGAITANEKIFRAAAAAYVTTGMTPAKQAIVNELNTAFDQWLQVEHQQLEPLARSNDDVGWIAVQSTKAQPLSATVQADVEKLAQTEAAEADAATIASTNQYHSQQTTSILILVAGIAAAVGIGLAVAIGIARATRKVQDVTTALAAGDLTKTSGLSTRDELGRMGAALDTAVESLRTLMGTVVASADAVAASSEELSASSAQIAASAEETSAQAGVVSAAAEQVSRNVQTVAAGAEEMGASIREIAQNASEAARSPPQAVTAAEATNETVAKLGRVVGRRSATWSRSSPRSPSRPTCSRSTPPSRPPGRARPARASPSSPTRSRSSPRRPRGPPRTSPAGSRRSRATPPARSRRSARSPRSSRQINDYQTHHRLRGGGADRHHQRDGPQRHRGRQRGRRDREQHHRGVGGGRFHDPGAGPDPDRRRRTVPDGR